MKRLIKKDNLIFILFLATIFILFRCVIFNGFIPSASMENTLMTKDRFIGLRLAQDYKRGDVVVLKFDEEEYYIKRIIGIGGDFIEIKKDKVYVNGKPLNEPYLKEKMNSEEACYIVPEGSYFFLGDNRNNSNDSRYWQNPFRMKKDIVARAWLRYWPSVKIIR